MEETFQACIRKASHTRGSSLRLCLLLARKKTVESRRYLYHGDVYSGENGSPYPVEHTTSVWIGNSRAQGTQAQLLLSLATPPEA